MRVSTAQLQRQAVDAIVDQQARAAKTQLQIASGRRILTPSDDPVGAARALDLSRSASLTEEHQRNADAATRRLGLEESVLGSVTDLIHRFRELAIQGNNATLTDTDREAIASEVRERLAELLGLANRRDAANEYLFAGYKTATQPFARTGAGFVYNGDQGQRFAQVGPSMQVAVGDSGAEVFQLIRNGNGTFRTEEASTNTGDGIIGAGTVTDPSAYVPDTYTITFVTATDYEVRDSALALVASGVYASGNAIAFNGIETDITGTPAAGDSFTVSPSTAQDLFTTVDDLAMALEADVVDDPSKGHFHNAMNRAIVDLDQALEHVLEIRTRVGGRLNAIEHQKEVNDAFALFTAQAMSDVDGLDMNEAASRLRLELTALQAAQQAYVRVQGISLFQLL